MTDITLEFHCYLNINVHTVANSITAFVMLSPYNEYKSIQAMLTWTNTLGAWANYAVYMYVCTCITVKLFD